MSSTVDVTVAFVVHAKTLRIFCLVWRVRVACQVHAKQGTVKYILVELAGQQGASH